MHRAPRLALLALLQAALLALLAAPLRAQSEPYLGEIKMSSFDFAPKGWALCNGQLLAINQNQALFSLLGTTYGGDGRVNFALPDLRGRVPIHFGTLNGGPDFTLGERGGEEAHTLNVAELPGHVHSLGSVRPQGVRALGGMPGSGPSSAAVRIDAAQVGNSGGSQAHANMAPFLVTNFIIALQGVFPSPN
jgi:microcystin-dependent protein